MSFLDKIKQFFARGEGSLQVINVSKRFDLMGRTGQGSMSKVWRARDREAGRVVCLKILDKEKTSKFEQRFMGLKKPSEGAICMSLKHPNIVTTYEHGLTTDKEPYVVMELIEGVGLNFLVETKNKQLEGNRVDFLRQFATGIAHMHKIGYLHRDICPRNCMVTKDGVVKVIDLGLALPYKPDFCKPGNRTGSTMYLAPEIIRRAPTDHRVDLFALGVTAFEVYTGDLPWEKAASGEALRAIVNQAARDPRELRPEMDDATVSFLLKAVERDAKARFQSAEAFIAALDELPPQ